jgi:hypothetical protein
MSFNWLAQVDAEKLRRTVLVEKLRTALYLVKEKRGSEDRLLFVHLQAPR